MLYETGCHTVKVSGRQGDNKEQKTDDSFKRYEKRREKKEILIETIPHFQLLLYMYLIFGHFLRKYVLVGRTIIFPV